MADESANGGILGHLPPWPRKALNNSVIAMEQAYRQRKGLPLLSDADVEALESWPAHGLGKWKRGIRTGCGESNSSVCGRTRSACRSSSRYSDRCAQRGRR